MGDCLGGVAYGVEGHEVRVDLAHQASFWVLEPGAPSVILGAGARPRPPQQFLASLNNHEEACNMHCGKGRVRTQDLGYQSGALWPLRYTPGRPPNARLDLIKPPRGPRLRIGFRPRAETKRRRARLPDSRSDPLHADEERPRKKAYFFKTVDSIVCREKRRRNRACRLTAICGPNRWARRRLPLPFPT